MNHEGLLVAEELGRVSVSFIGTDLLYLVRWSALATAQSYVIQKHEVGKLVKQIGA